MKNSERDNYSRYVLVIFLSINLLNYIDRQILYAVFPLVKADFNLSDTALGLLGSAFMLCYMISAPLLGWLGDRINRLRLSAVGLVLWSLATVLTSFASGYRMLLWARSFTGIGEASFSTVAPTLLADYFKKSSRGWVLSLFYLAIPVGSALGYILGGFLGVNFGWKAAFLIVGIPGLILALPLWTIREPPRGGFAAVPKREKAGIGDYLLLLKNRSFILNTLAMAAMTFAMGGLAQWMPSYFYRIHRVDLVTANTIFGGITILAGITGTLTGGWIGSRLEKRKGTRGYLVISGLGLLAGAPVALYSLITSSFPISLGAMFVAAFLIFFNTGPLNTVTVNVTDRSVRSMAFAVNIFFIHALGDAVSPTLLGWFSDLWGLRAALMTTPLALLFAAFFCYLCARFVSSDEATAEREGSYGSSNQIF
jgi:predicted MFS family arabinose efflux permease